MAKEQITQGFGANPITAGEVISVPRNGGKFMWRCQVCKGLVETITIGDVVNSKMHPTPTGGECRAVNFNQEFIKDSPNPKKTES